MAAPSVAYDHALSGRRPLGADTAIDEYLYFRCMCAGTASRPQRPTNDD